MPTMIYGIVKVSSVTGGSKGSQSGHGPYHGLRGLAPLSQAVAESFKGRWIVEISLLFFARFARDYIKI